MEEFPNQWPSDDQDLPFRITAPFGLEDSKYDHIIYLGSAAYPPVNSWGTNLCLDFPVEQQFEHRSPSISFESALLPKPLLLCDELELKLEFQRQLELELQRQLDLQLQRQLLLQLQLQPQCPHLNRLWVDLNRLLVDKRYNQELCCLFNLFHNHKINAKKLGTALKSLEEKYYYSGTDHRRFIHCGDVAGISLSRLEGAGSSGYPSTSGYLPGTNACGGGVPVGIGLVNNNGDPSSSVKHSPPGKGKVPHEEGAGGFADVSGDAIGSMNASHEGDLEMGLVNNNADPSALGDVRSSVVHHVDHTVAGSGVYGENVAMTIFQVATAAYRTATSKFAQASHTTSLATSMAAILLADTNWKAATPILSKAGIVVCGVGVLADIGKDLPLPLFMGATSAALLIIIVAILFAKRPA